ncbi:Uncharacterised protein [Dermatophilus congolensis]|uniref:Lipoprotein n=1 Tax=Dermatophilus congolensis TaxID=1863 RepID=A0AA46BLT1_9MICO|nr:hypothetical protein [Dermatophilus congolensis]STD05550.1 Uncharacterised protein [Dermatophilus congolensis]
MNRRFTLRAAATILVLPLALSACGNGGSSSDTGNTGQNNSSSAQSQGAGGPFNSQPGASVDKDTFVEKINKGMVAAGTYKISTKTTMPGSEMALNGYVDGREQGKPKFKGTVSTGGQTMNMIMANQNVYVQLAGLTGDKYIKTPLEDLLHSNGGNLSDMLDLSKQLQAQKAAIQSVTYVGQSNDSGTQVFQYKVKLDPHAAANLATGAPHAHPTAGAEKHQHDYFLDANGQLHKMNIGIAGAKSETTFSEYGKSVTITAPPTSEVTTMPALGGIKKPQTPEAQEK